MLGIPKPNHKAQRRKRRNEIKRKDKEFQSDGNPRSTFDQTTEYVMCAAGHSVERAYLAKHHVRSRRFMDTRWNDDIAANLCFDHHNECERMGDVAFAEKYKGQLLTHAPHIYALLKRSPELNR